MSDKQVLLAELLKVKVFLVGKLAHHTMMVNTKEMLDEINKIIDNIEKL